MRSWWFEDLLVWIEEDVVKEREGKDLWESPRTYEGGGEQDESDGGENGEAGQ